MSSEEPLLQCYNATCGQKYYESKNSDDACVYHTGRPVFHDAYKRWSCCEKKTTDFTEFLGIKGCTQGRHSNVKPVELDKKDGDNNGNVETLVQEILNKPLNTKNPVERPSQDIPLAPLNSKISPSLRQELDRLAQEPISRESDDIIDVTKVAIGTSCKNNGCKKSYQGPESNQEECLFHPGVPIFHEGMKYWSCCQRKTSDFEMFLAQTGCESGNHLWYKAKNKENTPEARSTSCRFDWHQTGSVVVVTIYSKLPIPEKCQITANPVKLSVSITFSGHEEKFFAKDFILFGIIDVDNSFVEYTPSKVEICMKKADQCSWRNLTLKS